MPSRDYKSFNCKECGKKKTVWDESISYREKLCADCLDKKYGKTGLLKKAVEELDNKDLFHAEDK
jgi:NAD-dependent SIR2 family protein deacetylase